MDRRFIEESFPVKEVSILSAKEKNIHSAGVARIHNWWARRPLSSSRATNYAALIEYPDEKNEQNKKKDFIIELSNWENLSKNSLIEKARNDILKKFKNKAPKILDPFSGGASIPLEAMRLGCETYSSDYNPVSCLIQKCILEYPQIFGNKTSEKQKEDYPLKKEKKNQLAQDVKKWGQWINEQMELELGEYYLKEKNGFIPIGFLWINTISCQNPNCGNEIPLIGNYWLCNKKNKKIAYMPIITNNKILYKIVGENSKIPENFNPSKGIIKHGIVNCPFCKTVIDSKTTKKIFQNKKNNQILVLVILYHPKKKGKTYRIANESDYEFFVKAKNRLEKDVKEFKNIWQIDPIPNEPTPIGKGKGAERAFSLHNYNLNNWGDLFNYRQKLIMIYFIKFIKKAYIEMVKEKYDVNYAKVVLCYLAFTLDKVANYYCILSRWKSGSESVGDVFSRAVIPIVLDYVEGNPITGTSGSWKNQLNGILKTIKYCSEISDVPAIVNQSSATELHYEDNFFDAIFTDPPYYDNIPYSYLSDFFYVWLKRSIGDLYPELFSTPITPKTNEIVAYTYDKSWNEAKEFFESMLKKSFKEIYRVLKPNGIAIIVYAHKTTEGWETVSNALLESGLNITASWPISTEMKGRLRAKESAALASSIYIIARKIEKEDTGLYPEVKKELNRYLNEKLERLWQEGISGADFFIAAIGIGIEIFGKYNKIIDYEGNLIKANILLEDVRCIVADFAIKQILHNGFSGEISPLTRFYVIWRWNFLEAKVHFDEARKLAQSNGINLEQEWNKGFIKKEKEFIRVLGPKDRKVEDLEKSEELIDVLHYILLLWEKGEKEMILSKLTESYGNGEAFYRVAQAISQCLLDESKEKKLLDGFLTGKEKIKENIKALKSQKKIERWSK